MKRFNIIVFAFILANIALIYQNSLAQTVKKSPITENFITNINKPSKWADSVMKKMSKREKLAQLLMVPIYPEKSIQSQDSLIKLVQNIKPGGFIIFQGSPHKTASYLNYLQQQLRVPAMVAIDGEWGLAMRIDSVPYFPYMMTLGAVQNEKLIYESGKLMAAQMKRLGVHINFAPVLDINNNPNNHLISYRAFSDNEKNVTNKGVEFMKGMQDGGIIAVGKHFPGHGSTKIDSHKELPIIYKSREALNSLELMPFKKAIEEAIIGVMVGHLSVPSIDSAYNGNRSAVLSPELVTALLRDELKFKGLVFSDAMDMKAIPNAESEQAVVDAFKAGIDIIVMPRNVEMALNALEKAMKKKEIDPMEVNRRCRRVLASKQTLGLTSYKPIYVNNLVKDFSTVRMHDYLDKIYKESITELITPEDSIVVKRGDKVAIISIGVPEQTIFQDYFDVTLNDVEKSYVFFNIPTNSTPAFLSTIKDQLQKYDKVVLGVHEGYKQIKKSAPRPADSLVFKKHIVDFVNEIITTKPSYIAMFNNVYSVGRAPFELTSAKGLWLHYEDNQFTEKNGAAILLGQIKAKGKLPIKLDDKFKLIPFVDTLNNKSVKHTAILDTVKSKNTATSDSTMVKEDNIIQEESSVSQESEEDVNEEDKGRRKKRRRD